MVQRSKSLAHPYVMIGSKRHPVTITPDYTLFADSVPLLVLDAKAPSEKLINSRHAEQAYSYAIHPEIRCDHYALCNGRELVLYSTRESAPVDRVDFKNWPVAWERLCQTLSPQWLAQPALRNFMADFGLHATRAGVGQNTKLMFHHYFVQLISKVEDDLFTACANHGDDDRDYIVSFDFTRRILDDIVSRLPSDVAADVSFALSRQPYQFNPAGKVILSVTGHLGAITEGEFEPFVPVVLSEVSEARWDPTIQLSPRKTRA